MQLSCMTGKLYIYNTIGWDVEPQDVRNQIAALGDFDSLDVHINSHGGLVSDGYAIRNILLEQGVPITTIADGKVGSIATIIFLAGKTRIMQEGTNFFIHNPWAPVEGDAAAMREAADQLEVIESEILAHYVERTGAASSNLAELMKAETSLTPQQAVELGFATEIRKPVYAMAALNKSNMGFLDKVMAKTSPKTITPKALSLTLESGQAIEVLTSENVPAVGESVMLEGGKQLDPGTYTIADSKVEMSVEGGKITELRQPESEEQLAILALATELSGQAEVMASMQTGLDSAIKLIEAQTKALEASQLEVKALKDSVSSNYVAPKAMAVEASQTKEVKLPNLADKQKQIREQNKR